MAEILAFRRQAFGPDRDNADDDRKDDRAAANLRSALDEVGKSLADLLLALLAALRAEQQEIRTTIAELRRAIGNEARTLGRA
jgi:hypothetical protein